MSSPINTIPAGWERRPDGTLVRRSPAPFSAEWLKARAVYRNEEIVGFIDPGGSPEGSWIARERFHDACGYGVSYHLDGRCPTEAEAREAAGR